MAERRERAYWMNSKDDTILEYLREVGVAEPLSVIFWNLEDSYEIGFSIHTLRRRLLRLVETGLVEIPRGGDSEDTTYYRITDDGIAYLQGDLRPDDLPEDFDGVD